MDAVHRDAFIAALCRFAMPSLEDARAAEGQSVNVVTDNNFQVRRGRARAQCRTALMIGGPWTRGPSLAPHSGQAMRTVFNVAQGLCEVLGPAWYHILEVLQAVDRGVRLASATAGSSNPSSSGGSSGIGGGPSTDKAGGAAPMLDKLQPSSSTASLVLGGGNSGDHSTFPCCRAPSAHLADDVANDAWMGLGKNANSPWTRPAGRLASGLWTSERKQTGRRSGQRR